jgi:hypothetical protein
VSGQLIDDSDDSRNKILKHRSLLIVMVRGLSDKTIKKTNGCVCVTLNDVRLG